jgi:pSer/pThr/pTyr-binding forkhead associated (FHA) protein
LALPTTTARRADVDDVADSVALLTLRRVLRKVGTMSSTPDAVPGAVFEVTAATGTTRVPAVGGVVRVGRSGEGNDIVLEGEPTVSRHHAEFISDGDGGWAVRDLSSHNGTAVNGVRLEGVAGVPVAPGDVVTLGDVTIRLTV